MLGFLSLINYLSTSNYIFNIIYLTFKNIFVME